MTNNNTHNNRPSAGPPCRTSDTTMDVSPLSSFGLSRPPDTAMPKPIFGSWGQKNTTYIMSCVCVYVCPLILVVCVNSHCIIMAACVLCIVIKGILAQIAITVVHTGVMYDCAVVQGLHVHLLAWCVINNDANPLASKYRSVYEQCDSTFKLKKVLNICQQAQTTQF